MEAEEQQVKAAYDEVNNMLLAGIPSLIDVRSPYLEPSLGATLKLQSKWTDDVNRQVEALNAPQISQNEVESTLDELRQLPILTM